MAELVRLGFLLTLWAFGIWVGGAAVTAWVAWEKGRDPAAWFVMAFFLSPLVALIALSAVPARHLARMREARRVRGAARPRPAAPSRLTVPVSAAARLVGGVRDHKVNA